MASLNSTKRAGRPRGRIWEHFQKVSNPPYSSGVAYATCVFCKPDGIPLSVVDTLTKIEDKKQRVEKAISFGLIPGKPETLARHLIGVCQHAPEHARALARDVLSDHASKRRKTAATAKAAETTPQHAPKTAPPQRVLVPTPTPTDVKPPRQQTPAPAQPTPKILRQVKKEFFSSPRYNGDMHARLIAEFVSVHKIPPSVLGSKEFRNLQDFYCNGPSVVDSNELQITANKITNAFLPFRAREAIARQKIDIVEGPLMSRGYTYMDDGWTSRAKRQITGVMIGRPGFAGRTIATLPTPCDQLNAVAIARGWEEFIVGCKDGEQKYDESSTLSRYTHIPNKPPVSICTDSAGPNVRARSICALRHPTITFLPCFAHLSALQSVDLLTYSNRAKVVSDCLHILHFFSKSSSKWLPRLRDAMKQVYGHPIPLLPGVVTRWISTWQSCCSVLRAQEAFEIVFKLHAVEVSKLIRLPDHYNLKRACDIVHVADFWKRLTHFLYITTPSIETSMLLQSGKATLGDVFYCYGRQAQAFIKCNEQILMQLLEKRFQSLEFPLLFLAFFLHPRYVAIASRLVDSDKVVFCDVAKWIMSYAGRWQLTVSDPTQSIIQWMCGTEGGASWCKHATACVQSPGDFWWTVSGRRKANNDGLQCMGEVAIRIFSMLPNASDPERLFSEVGRVVTPQRVRYNDHATRYGAIIAADVRTAQRESDAADLKNGILRQQVEFCASIDMIVEKAALVSPDSTAAGDDAVGSTSTDKTSNGNPKTEETINTNNNSTTTTSNEHTTDTNNSDSRFASQNGGGGPGASAVVKEEVGEEKPGASADLADEELGSTTVNLEEEELSDLAASDFNSYVIQLGHVVAYMHADEASNVGCTDIEDVRRQNSLKKYALGELPLSDDKDIPEEMPQAFRSDKCQLRALFNKAIVGEVPSVVRDFG